MDFGGIIGQQTVVASLSDALANDRVSHAYILNGPAGIGKRTVAGIFGRMLLCTGNSSAPAHYCGSCPSCRLMESGASPDYAGISPEGNSILVEQVRGMQAGIMTKPMYSDRKVYLLVSSEKMTEAAQNCLLKMIENPPSYAVIILVTQNADSMLETVRSRCTRYNFKVNTRDEVYRAIAGRPGAGAAGAAELDFIVSYSGGIIGTALELAGSPEFTEMREKALDIGLRISQARLVDVFEAYGFFEEHKDDAEKVLDLLLLLYRDLLVCKCSGDERLLINSDKKDIILVNAPRFTVRKLVSDIDAVEAARFNIRRNVNFQLSMEVMLMKLQEDTA